MKKLIALCLAILLLASLSVPAFAAASPEQDTGEGGGGKPTVIIGKLVVVDADIDNDDVTATYVDPVTGEVSDVIVCIKELTDEATDQMREDFEKLESDTKNAEKALTAANASNAVKAAANTYPQIMSKLKDASVTASKPERIVASSYPCTVKVIIRENPGTVLFPMLFDGSKWSVPEDLSIIPESDFTTLSFRLNGPAHLTLVRSAGGVQAP